MKALLPLALTTAAALATGGCAQGECVRTADCAVGFACTIDGFCVSEAAGDITWVSPEPGSVVGPTFDAVVEVSFRAAQARIFVDRDRTNPGEACAPFVPTTVTVGGDLREALVQQVTIPGLRALGEDFGVSATLNAAGGLRNVTAQFRSEPTGYEGARIELGGLIGDGTDVADASGALALPVSAVLERAASRALVSVEPVGKQPSPRQLVGAGITELLDVRTPIARGAQIVWVDTEDEAGAHRCGKGLEGLSTASTGVELGLSFDGAEPGQLDLRVRLRRSDLAGGDVTCSFLDPRPPCEAVYETRAPTRAGEEVLRIDATDGVLEIIATPGAAGPPLLARIRVSNNGAHVGWLGPFPVQPALGETWLAGDVELDGGAARIRRQDEITTGPPPF